MTFPAVFGHLPARISWLTYALSCLWLALALSWWLSACFDYSYPFWYSVLDIEAHIDEYAPQNPEKPGFAQLPPERHHRAFAQISHAVHNGGAGLERIRYPGPSDRDIILLNQDEINHLQDVANLLDALALVSAAVALLWLPLAAVSRWLGRPSRRVRLAACGMFAAVVLAPLVFAGPEAVFNTIHEWVFPPEHPWFFYWQESLMSTLMKAPVLFGGIAAQIALVGLLLTPLIYLAGYWLGERFLSWWRPRHVD